MSISGNIWRGTLFVSVASLVARVGTFTANLVVIRLLGRDLIGQLGLIEGWLTVTSILSLFGVGIAVTKYVAEYLETDIARVGRIIGVSWLLGGVNSLVVGGVSYIWISSASFDQSVVAGHVLANYALLFFGLTIASTLRHMGTGVVYGLQSFRFLVVVNIVIGLLSFPVTYYLVQRYDLAGVLEARLFLTLIEMLLLAYAGWSVLRTRGGSISLRGGWHEGYQLGAFGLPILVGQLSMNPIQPIMMSWLASQPGGLAQVGLLTVAQRLCSLANFLPGAMASILTPILSSAWGGGERADFRINILTALRMLCLTTLPIVVVLLAASPSVLGWLYGEEFREAWQVTFVMLIVMFLTSLNETSDRALMAAGHIWVSTGNNLFWLLIFCPLEFVLIPRGLALGYALGFLGSYALYFGVQVGWLWRLFGVSMRAVLALMIGSGVLIVGPALALALMAPGVGQGGSALVLLGLTLVIEYCLFLNGSERARVMAYIRRNTVDTLANVSLAGWKARREDV